MQIYFKPIVFLKSTLLHIICLLLLLQSTAAQSPYPHFDSWPIVKLKGGMLVCSDYDIQFEDDFSGTELDESKWDKYENGDPYGGRFHCTAEAVIFTDENVRVNNGQLELTVKRETTPYILNPPPGDPTFYAHCYEQIPYLKRNVTGGLVMVDQSRWFNLGKYEIRCKFPNKGKVWSAFWMWHWDEIDIFDFGFASKFLQNSISGYNGYTATIEQVPCCPFFRDCDYCSTNNVDCTGSPNCEECGLDKWGCQYMSDGFHTVGCEWTPFKIRFYVDGVTTGTVYRYHYLDKTPVDVDCGGVIPEGLVRENPAFVSIPITTFRPEIWISAEKDYCYNCAPGTCLNPCQFQCTIDECLIQAGPNDLPATLIVDYVKIEERVYERISLVPECYGLCDDDNVCVNLDWEYYNYNYDGNWIWEGPPKPVVTSWFVPSNNSTVLSLTPDKGCFTYDGPDCTVTPCERRMRIQANVQTHTGATYSLSKMLLPPKPEIIHSTLDDGTKQVCIDRDNYCGDYDVTMNGQIIDTENQDINCLVEMYCNISEVTYQDCGIPVKLTEATAPNPANLPKGFRDNNIPISFNTTNYIPSTSVNFCFPEANNPGLAITSVTQGSYNPMNQVLIWHDENCVYLTSSGNYAVGIVNISFNINGCSLTKKLIFAHQRHFYHLYPNPTTGTLSLEAYLEPVIIEISESETVEIRAHPQHLSIFDINNYLVTEMPLHDNESIYQLNLPMLAPPGMYIAAIRDGNTEVPITIQLLKQ